MTPARFSLFVLGVVFLVALIFPLAEAALELKGASLIIAVAGVLTVLGGLLGVFGAILNSTEQAALILGDKDTFCQLIVYLDPVIGWYISTFHYGPGRAYGVQAQIREVREDGTPVSDINVVQVGDLIGGTWPVPVFVLGIKGPQENLAPRYFSAVVNHRLGTSVQDIVIHPRRDGSLSLGFLRLEFRGRSYPPAFHYLPRGLADGIVVSEPEIQRIFALRKAREAQQCSAHSTREKAPPSRRRRQERIR